MPATTRYLRPLDDSPKVFAGFPSASVFNKLAQEAAKMQKHILIADDNSLIREVVKDVLTTALDIEDCQEAANGREAIERAEQSKPDLIILDVAMPVMDGITAAKRLKVSMPETPIILFTMHDLGRDRAKELGVDAVVSKPEGLGRLTQEVESLLAVH